MIHIFSNFFNIFGRLSLGGQMYCFFGINPLYSHRYYSGKTDSNFRIKSTYYQWKNSSLPPVRPSRASTVTSHCHTVEAASKDHANQCPHRPTPRPHRPSSRPHNPTPYPHHFAIRTRNPKVITTRLQPRLRRSFRKTSPGKFATTPGNSMRRGSPRCSPPTVKVQQIPS